MEKVFETQEEMTGYITGKVKGGYIATVEGLPCFMPSSQIDVRPLKKMDHLMNVPVKVIATRIDRNRGNVCVSRRAVLEKSKNAEITEALKNINSKHKSFAIPLIIFISILVLSSSVYFRNNVVSLSHSYFPNFVEKNFYKVFDLFKHVKIPFYADFKYLEIENFGAVYEGKSVKFFGNIKNNSKNSPKCVQRLPKRK